MAIGTTSSIPTSTSVTHYGTGLVIRDLRNQQKLSQEDLAIEANVSVGTVRAVERGHLPRVEIVAKLAAALGHNLMVRFEPKQGKQAW